MGMRAVGGCGAAVDGVDVVAGAPELTPVAIMAGKLLARRLYGLDTRNVGGKLRQIGGQRHETGDEGGMQPVPSELGRQAVEVGLVLGVHGILVSAPRRAARRRA